MTTVQLFHRIGRRARGNDFTKLALSEQGDIEQSVNSALAQIYNALPTYFKELTEGIYLSAPVTTTLTVTRGSPTLSSDVFTAEQFGRSIMIEGDPTWNQILGTNRLLNPYLGVTGTHDATIYSDAAYSERYPFDRIIGNPRLADASRIFLTPALNRAMDNSAWNYPQALGVPAIWGVQMLGNSQGNEPLLVLRFSPAPSSDTALNIRMSFWAKRLTMDDYKNAAVITVPDQFLEVALIPIALEALMSTPIWASLGDEANIVEQANAGRAFCKSQPGQVAAPNNRVGTPFGY